MDYFKRPWWWYATVAVLLGASWGLGRVLSDVFPAHGSHSGPRFAVLALLTLSTFFLAAWCLDAPKHQGKDWWVLTLIACAGQLLLDLWLGT